MDQRRKFEQHIHIDRREEAKKTLAMLRNPRLRDYKAVIEDYLRILRIRFPNNEMSIFNWQMHILIDIGFTEAQIRTLKQQKKTIDPKENSAIDYIDGQIRELISKGVEIYKKVA